MDHPFPPSITKLIGHGALVAVNHSGGKDSQAMTVYLERHVPADQLVIFHAILPDADWPDAADHIRTQHPKLPLITVQAKHTLLDLVDRRGKWPSMRQRYCTSDLKRNPIATALRAFMRHNPKFNNLLINALGLRAQESSSRAKKPELQEDLILSKAGRTALTWHPIHLWTEAQVFDAIKSAGQTPHHAYGRGYRRLSCPFCIYASPHDLARAAHDHPELYDKYRACEVRNGHTLSITGRTLEQTVASATKLLLRAA